MNTTHFELRAMRARYGLTQNDLATLLDIHKATYNRKERGMIDFSLSEAKALADHFHITIEDLFYPKER